MAESERQHWNPSPAPERSDRQSPRGSPEDRQAAAAASAAARGVTAAVGAPRAPLGVYDLLSLQRTVGNQATARIVQRGFLEDLFDIGPIDAVARAHAAPGLPRTLVTHYMVGSGADYTLSREEMLEIDAQTNVFTRFPKIIAERDRLLEEAIADDSERTEWEVAITGAQGQAGANKNGTLGTFTITLDGTLTLRKGRYGIIAEFEGTATYYDYWDFDPKPIDTLCGDSERTVVGEVRVWLGTLMQGAPFNVVSGDTVNVRQTQLTSRASIS